MRVGKNKQGYTIVETMIFLAVSGLMFVMAASAISGKQAKAEFKQGMTSTNTQIRQIINDVGNGTFDAGATCGLAVATTEANSGSNKGCVFLGKIFNFTSSSNYSVSMLTGNQFKGANVSISDGLPLDLAQSNPQISTSVSNEYSWGITETAAYDMSTGSSPLSDIAFIKSFTGDAVNGSSDTASQDVNVVPVPLANHSNPIPYLNTNNKGASANILICFKGGSNEYGSITIGGSNGQRLTTDTKISTGVITGCPA